MISIPSRSSLRTPAFASLALLLLGGLAQAHPGHSHGSGIIEPVGFMAGLTHPWGGWDHLLAMLAIGLWAAQLGGRAVWAVPATFVSLAAVGGALGMNGIVLPMVEQGILASVFVLGLMVLMAARLPLAASAGLAAVFALFHGFAHGVEMPVGGSGLTFSAGFLLSTVALHALGLGLGKAMQSTAKPVWLRAAGAAVMVAGGVLALS